MLLAAGQLNIGNNVDKGLRWIHDEVSRRSYDAYCAGHGPGAQAPDVLVLPELLNLGTFQKGFEPAATNQDRLRKIGDWLCKHVPMGWLRKSLLTIETEPEYLQVMTWFSRRLPHTYIVGGSVVVPVNGKLVNMGYVMYDGKPISCYTKKHITEVEVALGVKPDNGPSCIMLPDGRRLFSVICWDVDFVDDWTIPEDPARDDILAVASWGWRPMDAWQEDSEDANFIQVAKSRQVNMIRTFWAGNLVFGRYAGCSAIISSEGNITRAPMYDQTLLMAQVP